MGSYIVSGDDGRLSVQPYCGTDDTLHQIEKIKKQHPTKTAGEPALEERRIRYILTTANNWSGPIKNFRLSVLADHPDDIVLTCMPGLKQVAPMRYELSHSNFRPDRELDLLILQSE